MCVVGGVVGVEAKYEDTQGTGEMSLGPRKEACC